MYAASGFNESETPFLADIAFKKVEKGYVCTEGITSCQEDCLICAVQCYTCKHNIAHQLTVVCYLSNIIRAFILRYIYEGIVFRAWVLDNTSNSMNF